MTGYFRSLARRASGQGGWIRPVLAPIVVPEAAPLVETSEERVAPADPVAHARPASVDRSRLRDDAIEETRPAPETRSILPSELVHSLRARRREPVANDRAVPGPLERRPAQVHTGDSPAGDVRPARQASRQGAARAPEPLEALAQPPQPPAIDPPPPEVRRPALGPVATAARDIEQSTALPSGVVAEPLAAAREAPVPPAIRADSPSRSAARRPAPLSPPETIAIPAPRSSGQVVNVTIGRVEVRAPAPPAPPAPRPAPKPVPMMSLADYLRERGGRR